MTGHSIPTSASQHFALAEHHLSYSQQSYSLRWAAFHFKNCISLMTESGEWRADQAPIAISKVVDQLQNDANTIDGSISPDGLWELHGFLTKLLNHSSYRSRLPRIYRDLAIVLMTLICVGVAYRKYAHLPINLWSHEYSVMDVRVEHYEQGYGDLQINKTVDMSPVVVGGVPYANAIGTHANSTIEIAFEHAGTKLSGACGYPDSAKGGSIYCTVENDGKILFKSEILSAERQLAPFSVPIASLSGATLRVLAATASINFDHAVWVNLKVSND